MNFIENTLGNKQKKLAEIKKSNLPVFEAIQEHIKEPKKGNSTKSRLPKKVKSTGKSLDL